MPKQKKTAARSLKGSIYNKAEASPGFLFWKTFNTWSRHIRAELEKLDLTQVQYSILAAVKYLNSADETISQQDVANQLSMDKMMVSDVVKTLERKKLVFREPHPSDGRSSVLRLTADAHKRLKQAVPAVEAADEKFFGRLESKQKKIFGTFLSILSESL